MDENAGSKNPRSFPGKSIACPFDGVHDVPVSILAGGLAHRPRIRAIGSGLTS